MRNSKRGGKRLFKIKHHKKESLRRWFSRLLSLCIAVSLLGGAVSFPALAQETRHTESKQETREEIGQTEAREETKTRLLRQIKEEGWDPYSEDMSLDEFYALMELFQEGILPLAEEGTVVEDSVTAPGLDETDDEEPDMYERSAKDSNTETSDTGNPDAEDSNIGDPDTEDSDTETSGTGNSDAEDSNIQDSDAEDSDTKDSDSDIDGSDTGESKPQRPKTVKAKSEESDTHKTDIGGRETGQDAKNLYIPRTMFLLSGVNTESLPGTDAAGYNWGTPLEYHNETGDESYLETGKDGTERTKWHYPAGLGFDGHDYTRPPEGWEGVKIKGNMQASVVVLGSGEEDGSISGDVDQKLFLQYDGHYVRRVRAQNNDVTILGVIELREQNSYVYYYINNEQQSTEVSVTTLPEGQKFIIEYSAGEHSIGFQVKMNDVNGEDVTPEWIDNIFGTDRPSRANLGAYAFTAQVPVGYTLSFYLSKKNPDGGWDEPKLQLGTKEERGEESEGLYTGVNGGWALGEEPVYEIISNSGYSVLPNTDKGPGSLTTSGTFYNNLVEEDRIIIAVLRKKPRPVFEVKPVQMKLSGVYDNAASSRGTAAAEDYDWEADYDFAAGRSAQNPYPVRPGNTQFPNLGKIIDPNWGWGGGGPAEMTEEPDGTYSYSWLFQTNNAANNWYMDALEINGVGITVPFYPKHLWDNQSGESTGSESGMDAWYTETTLPDGAVVKVEYLLVFGSAQRHYRISVQNARSDVTITGMNLMTYSMGAPEFSIYHLEGITGAEAQDSDARVEAIQYYDIGIKNGKAGYWSEDQQEANVIVRTANAGIDYEMGDTDMGGANIRFRLADGYDSPYYLYESAREGVIYGKDRSPQASAVRNEVTGRVDRESQNAVVPYVSDGTRPWMKYDGDTPIPVTAKGELLYDEDGNPFTDWSRIRVEEDGGGQVLIPRLYASPGPHDPEDPADLPLTKEEVIAGKGEKVFRFGEDINAGLKSQYIYAGADGWYYIRLTGQDRRVNDDAYADTGSAGGVYKIALLTIVAYPKRYVVRYMPNTLEEFEDAEGNIISEPRLPENMPVIDHSDTCSIFFQLDDPNRPEEQFDDNAGAFYDVAVNTVAVLSRTRPTDPKGYYKFVDWMLVGEDCQPVRRHVTGPDGNWLKTNGEYVMEEVHFTSGSINIQDIAEFGILNDDMGSIDMDIYVLRLMPAWDKIGRPFHYTVALNWVDASGGLHDEYFHEMWSDVLTYYEQSGSGLTVRVLTDADPFRKWLAQHPTYTFWDAVNNATNGAGYDETDAAHADRGSEAYKNLTDDEKSEKEKIQDALDAYFSELMIEDSRQTKYDAALQALLNKDKEGGVKGDDFDRNGDYTFTVWEDTGVIVIWMYESGISYSGGYLSGSGNSSTSTGVGNSQLSPSFPNEELLGVTLSPEDFGLPQTGQLWWPVPLLIAAGMPLLMIGALLFVRKEESEERNEPYE